MSLFRSPFLMFLSFLKNQLLVPILTYDKVSMTFSVKYMKFRTWREKMVSVREDTALEVIYLSFWECVKARKVPICL